MAGYSATSGNNNTFVGVGSGYFVSTGAKNVILGGHNGNQGGLDIRTASNYIVLSDGDGNPRRYIDNDGRNIETFGAAGLYQYRMRHWVAFQSAFDNPTTTLCRITGGTGTNSAMVKVRVFQLFYSGSAAAGGNEHIGLGWVWGNGSAHTTFVNTMTTTTTIGGVSNVGTLSWSSNGSNDTTFNYTPNRASNYDAYYVEIEITQVSGSNFAFITPT